MATLDPRQWNEVERLFAAALDLPPDRRQDFLQQACADPDVHREAASLLDHAGDGLASVGEAIAAASSALAGDVDPDERLIDTRLGPYRVEAIAGHGGMGAVYRALRDDAEFHQVVAIKLVRAAAESPATLRRFKQERQILARLAHPHIARLLDGGSTPEGVPYLVMEFIEGQPITSWCKQRALEIEDRLRLFLHVCEAVAFAHRERVVHRDLKPANILVTRDGAPKLLDFGIAKLLDPDPQSDAFSITNLQAMTPDYASPEQVRGEAASAATDIYALGLVLYEMLTGQKAQEIPNCTPDAIRRVVCHMEPKAPGVLKPLLAGDLDNIVRMAIRKEPNRRYASVPDMARDIQRHLDGRTVAARPDTLRYRAAKFLRRNRAAAVVGAAAAAMVIITAAWISLAGGFVRAPRVLRVVQITQSGRVDLDDGIATDGSRVYFTERFGGRWSLAQVPAQGGPAQILSQSLAIPGILDISPDRSQLLVGAGMGENVQLYLIPTAGGPPRRLGDLYGYTGTWSRDGRSIVFSRGLAVFRVNADGTGYRKLFDTPGRAANIQLSPAPGPEVLRFALLRGDLRNHVLWEASIDGARMRPLPLPGWKTELAWPDSDDDGIWVPPGNYYLFRSKRGGANSVWARRERFGFLEAPTARPAQIYTTPLDIASMAPTPDGKRIFFAAGQERRELVRYDAGLRQFVPFLSGVHARGVGFSKDGHWVAYTLFPDDTLWRCRADGSERLQLTPGGTHAFWPQWSPDGTQIAFGDPSSAKVFVVPSNGGTIRGLTKAAQSEFGASWSPDGRSVVVWRGLQHRIANSGSLYITDLSTASSQAVPGSESTGRPAWSPDGRYIAGNTLGKLRIFDLKSRQWMVLVHGTGLGVFAWSPDARYLYFQYVGDDPEESIQRVRIADRVIERVAGLSQIPQSDLTGFLFASVDPSGSPIVSLLHTNSEIYALDIDWP
ncbi:MAG: protein kinase [Bryobacteraceae bacterium]|jgi:Tol biopolymer transport system component